MSEKCEHFKHGGGYVCGFWICANCYQKLPERPRKLFMVRSSLLESIGEMFKKGGEQAPRQDVKYAPEIEVDGVTLSMFIDAMARRIVAQTRGGMGMDDARLYSLAVLESLGDPFGHKDLSWDEAGAIEIVDEDMQCWDFDGGGENG